MGSLPVKVPLDNSATQIHIMTKADQEYLTVEETADLIGCSVSTVRRALRHPDRPLPHIKLGLGAERCARVLCRHDEVLAWIESHRVTGAEASA